MTEMGPVVGSAILLSLGGLTVYLLGRVHGEPVRPVQVSRALKRLRDAGLTTVVIGPQYGKSKS